MSYLDEPTVSNKRLIALGAVALIHVGIGWALMNGLASTIKKVVQNPMEAFDIAEIAEEVEEAPPPPPPEQQEVFVPPPAFDVFVPAAPTPAPVTPTFVPAPPPPPPPVAAPPPREPVRVLPKALTNPRRLGELVSDLYPDGAARRGIGGRGSVTLVVSADGKIRDCMIARSTGDDSLDKASCTVARRMKFEAGSVDGTPTEMQVNQTIVWVPPKE
jgi:periplasmic protein TonB